MVLPLIPIAIGAGIAAGGAALGSATTALVSSMTAKKEDPNDVLSILAKEGVITSENVVDVSANLGDKSVFSGSSPLIGSKTEEYQDSSSYTDNRTYEYVYTLESPGASISTNQQPTNTTTQTPSIQNTASKGTGILDTLSNIPILGYVLGGVGIFCAYKLATSKKGGNDA